MTCKCIEQVNSQLAPYNTVLCEEITLDFGTMKCGTDLVIATRKINGTKGPKARTVVAAFCPFCGKSFASKPKAKRKQTRTTGGK